MDMSAIETARRLIKEVPEAFLRPFRELIQDLRDENDIQAVLQGIQAEIPTEIRNRKDRSNVGDVESPYLNSKEAAAYLKITVKALYHLVGRKKLRVLPGSRHYRFTREMLDAYLQTDTGRNGA
jgi:excisionase family DNA binding protein